MYQFILSSLRSGIRSRSFQIVAIFGCLLVGVAYLAASFSPRQPRTVALDVGLSGLRISLVLLSLFWVQELLAKEIDRKTVVFSLSYPVSRAQFLIGRYLGVLSLNALAALALALGLLAAVVASGVHYDQRFLPDLGLPYWLAILGIWLDVAVVTAIAMAVASLSTVQMMSLAIGAAAAIAGRALGPAIQYLAYGASGEKEMVATYQPILKVVQWILPDLSRLDWRDWSIYAQNVQPELFWSATLMAVAYSMLIMWLAVIVFRRRELF